MSLLANSNAIESGGYPIQRSLRFRSSASAYLNRTFTTPTSGTTYTYSGWFKRGDLSSYGWLLTATAASPSSKTDWAYFYFDGSNGFLRIGDYNDYILTTTAVFRDPSAWYHIVMSVDTTQATATNRIKIYVNGVQYSYTQNASFPAQNEVMTFGKAVEHRIGRNSNSSDTHYFDGYATEVNFIDGQALTPSSFGETSAETGVWTPKKYTGTYGTNGFYLPFSDNTSATTLAYDKSGNGNNWTANNISTTAGTTYDSMTDVPTLTSATAANYCVLNPLDKGSATVSDGNLRASYSSYTNWVRGTFGVSSGKWYWEMLPNYATTNNQFYAGVATAAASVTTDPATQSSVWVYFSYNGNKINGSAPGSAYGASWAIGDVIGVAFDADNGTLAFYKNGVSQGTAFTGLTTGPYFPMNGFGSGQTWIQDANFGQRPFSYTPPTGFKALNTYNLPDPIIKKPNQYMDATLWTGNGTSQTIANSAGFAPDLVWGKSRSNAYQNILVDSVRGGTTYLQSSTTAAEATNATVVSGLTSTGFSVGSDATLNGSGTSNVGWQWKKGATPGFDIVTYTGNATARDIPHSLGVAPKFIIVKDRTSANPWPVYHASLGVQYYTLLNASDASYNNLANYWGSTAPTSSVFSVNTYGGNNANGDNFVAYLFAEIPGFSKFGSYTGNGSSDGPFCYTGFRPAYVMVKASSSAGESWSVYDNKRNGYNIQNKLLYPNLSNAENAGVDHIDLLSNGFKLRSNNNNTNGTIYIYACFAESPFKTSLAR